MWQDDKQDKICTRSSHGEGSLVRALISAFGRHYSSSSSSLPQRLLPVVLFSFSIKSYSGYLVVCPSLALFLVYKVTRHGHCTKFSSAHKCTHLSHVYGPTCLYTKPMFSYVTITLISTVAQDDHLLPRPSPPFSFPLSLYLSFFFPSLISAAFSFGSMTLHYQFCC